MKILRSGAELFHADGRIDMKVIVTFRNLRTRLTRGKQLNVFIFLYQWETWYSFDDINLSIIDGKEQQGSSRHILCRCLDYKIAETGVFAQVCCCIC